MSDFWNALKNTAESLGGAALAPAGAALDLAQMPFDDKEDDFGSVFHVIADMAGKTLDPVVNPQSGIAQGLGATLDAMNWAYFNLVSEPLATANMVNRHAFGGLGSLGPLGAVASVVSGRGSFSEFVDPQSWADAYKRANQQDNALGTAFAYGALNPTSDPLATANPGKDLQAEHGALGTGLAWTGEIAGMIGLDPSAAALKGAGVARGAYQYARLNPAQKSDLLTLITDGSQSGKLGLNLQSRTDKFVAWIGGENKLGRPLSAPEIYHGTPELKRYARDPEAVAGFLAEANKITDPVARGNAQRRIIAVAGGDLTQVARLRAESTEAASLADQLSNMAREGVIDLDALAVAPTLANNPVFRLRLENQLNNMNKSGAVDKFIDDFVAANDRLLETQKSLPNLPGVHAQGKRALNRMNDTGLARKPQNALDNWSASLAASAQSASSVFQKGKYSVPLVAVRTVGFMASPWTKAPIAASDALRRTHFTGVANIHDWGSSATQLDVMMQIGQVDQAARLSLLDEAYLASTESAKQAIINRVERASMQSLARWAEARSGKAVNADYITNLMERGAGKRSERLTSLKGRIYAATEDPTRVSASAVEDAAAFGQSRGFTPKSEGKWRLDQINDDGTPLALPVFETQLGNYVPLFDVDLARKVLARDTGYLSRASRAWEVEAREVERLSALKAAGVQGLDRTIQARAAARDWLVDMGHMFLRGWKFTVLFRLGYPMRVLTDDHLRINAKIGAGSFYGPNLTEFGGNLKQNLGRGGAARAELHGLKVRRQQIIEELDGNEMAVHLARQDDLRAIERKIGSHERAVAGLRKQLADEETKASLGLGNNAKALRAALTEREGDLADRVAARDYLLEQLGDYGPDALKAELDDITSRIDAGAKALRAPKKHIGEADVPIGDGLTIPGAFAGEFGATMRAASSSGGTYEALLEGAEKSGYRAMAGGSHRTIQPDEAGHLDAWADALNNQINTSEVGKFFLEGGTVDEFTRWIRRPEQAALRRRVSHFAHDPEDWGGRAWGIVHDYVPNEEVRQALLSGRVTPKQLREMVPAGSRPAVHGRAAADNLGTSHAVQALGNAMNRLFRGLGETPTNVLSRHPYFNSLYQLHAKDFYAVRKAGKKVGERWTQADVDEIAHLARRAALKDLRSSLFDLSAHSHAAHVMRFISPFFGAHQEGVMRWWRIAADKPQVVRRLVQTMDMPRHLGIEVDEDGNLVKPGDPLSSQHRVLLQLPQAFGGPDPEKVQSKWSISENSFNIILQGGLTNPGTGPFVSVPMDYLARHYASDPAIARVARIFNPFPSSSPLDNVLPATGKRLSAYIYGETGMDPSNVLGLGIGKREYNDAFAQNMQDAMVGFQLDHGREPTRSEVDEMKERVGAESTSQMFHRLLWNAASPAPASPRSKYAVFQQGWYKIQEQAKAEGQDFDWAYERFKTKYGPAYLPLIFSTSNNPGWVDANAGNVAAIRQYKGLLTKVDPALTRMVIGAYSDDLIAANQTLGEYSVDARNYLRAETIAPGSDDTYYSYDEPAQAVNEQMARRGWQKYGELTAALTAQAQTWGMNSYNDSPQLVAIKRAAVDQIKSENYAWADEWDKGVDRGQYNRYLDDMRQIVSDPALANDAERTDIQTLKMYLSLRDYFTQVFAYREAQGWGTFEAQAQDQVRAVYTALVGQLVESNTYFEAHMWNGTIENGDPYLVQPTAPVTNA